MPAMLQPRGKPREIADTLLNRPSAARSVRKKSQRRGRLEEKLVAQETMRVR